MRVPDDHPLVTALAAQKQKNTALQAQVGALPGQVAEALRGHLIGAHQIPVATADALITGTTPEQVLAQVAAVTGLTGQSATAPLLGTTTPSPPTDNESFVSALFGGTDS